MQDEIFDKGIQILQASYPNLNITKDTLEIWWSLLNDLSDDSFEKAIISICQTVREIYPGTNIVALIREKVFPQQTLSAWLVVIEAVRRYDYYTTITFEDKNINGVIFSGWNNWAKFCDDISNRGAEWVQKDFERIYNLFCEYPRKEIPDRLLGWHDLQVTNIVKTEPIVITDRRKRKEITK